MGYAVVLGVPERPSGEGSQLRPPQPSAALGLARDSHAVPQAPWGTARLSAALVTHRKGGRSLGLCQAVGSTWALGSSREEEWDVA